MKAKLIYEEGSSYFGGINPYSENWYTVIEVEGKYYKIHEWGNHTNSGRTISSIEFDPKNIPEEYKRTEESTKLKGAGTRYSLVHGNLQEIEIDLTNFDEYDIPIELRETYIEEIKSLGRKRINEKIESDPSLDYHTIIESADLTAEQQEIALSVIKKIEEELMDDQYLELSNYRQIIENLVSIAKGESIIVTHKNAYYSRPEDELILVSDFKEDSDSITLATSGEHCDYAWGTRRTENDVFSLQGKKVNFKDGRSYLGSYWKQGYSIDMMMDEGIPYIKRNVYENWRNSQEHEGIIDESLPVDRFDISTGEEGSFKEYNDEVHQKKSAKRNFYINVMEETKKQFGLSSKQVKQILDYAGAVTVLNLATDFDRKGLSIEQAVIMSRKTSHRGMEKVLSETGIDYPEYKFDIIQKAVRTLIYISTFEKNYSTRQIEQGINPTQGELDRVTEETLKGLDGREETR